MLDSLWRKVKAVWKTIDNALVKFSFIFGATETDWRWRYGVFILVYGGIYALGIFTRPFIALPALFVGYIGIFAIGRAWVANEKERKEIVRKMKEGNPDMMIDMRRFALVSAVQIIILFPIMFWQIQEAFALYTVPKGTPVHLWFFFSLDSFSKSILDWSEIYDIHFSSIKPTSIWGKHLLMFKRLSVDIILIQAIIRIFSIRETINEAVAAIKEDHSLAVRVGMRAFEHLLHALNDKDEALRANATKALGKLGDPRAVEPLIHALDDNLSVRANAIEALGNLGDPRAVEPLIHALNDEYPWVQNNAATALGKLGDLRAVEPLIHTLKDHSEVRANATIALVELGDPRAFEPFLHALNYKDEWGARVNAAKGLGNLGDLRAVEPLINALNDEHSEVRANAVEALGKLGDPRAVEPLINALNDEYVWVRLKAAKGLGKLGDSRGIKTLIPMLNSEYDHVRKFAAQVLEELGHPVK